MAGDLSSHWGRLHEVRGLRSVCRCVCHVIPSSRTTGQKHSKASLGKVMVSKSCPRVQ